MNLIAATSPVEHRTRLFVKLAAVVVLPLMLGGCGKKEEKAATPPPASPMEQKPVAVPKAPEVTKPAEASKPQTAPSTPVMKEPGEPKATAPAESKPVAAARTPADAEAWKLWDRAAERMRDIGAEVRTSTDPRRLEAVVSQMNDDEARIIVRNAYTILAGGDAWVVLYDGTGARIAEATVAGVTGR